MSLIHKFISELIGDGQITLITPGAKPQHFGERTASPNLTVRSAGKTGQSGKVGFHLKHLATSSLGFVATRRIRHAATSHTTTT